MNERWQCLSVTVPHEVAEAIANFLIELGSSGIVEGAHDPSQPQAPTTTVQGFFPTNVSRQTLCDAVTRYLEELAVLFPTAGQPTLQLSQVTSDTWQDHWRTHFPPLQVGTRFLVLPPWDPPPPDTDRHVIIIDPSMAFGTGHHATTQGCLEAIEFLWATHGLPPRALDLGTGSGILAIALAKLGTPEVWATDIDSIALAEARKNAEVNQVRPALHLSDKPLEQLSLPFPLIIANLFAATLISLAPIFLRAVVSEGFAILSGIQTDQEPDVHTAFPTPLWQPFTHLTQDEWVTLVLQRA